LNYCHSPVPLNAETRHHLLAAMLQVDDKQMPWTVQANVTLPWENDRQFLSELGGLVKAEETLLSETVKSFYTKGLLTKTQMDSTRPKLAVVVFDDRQPTQPANLALPKLVVQDSRTSYRISSWR
jgi:hypothetical protein